MVRAGVSAQVCRVEEEEFKIPKTPRRKSQRPDEEIESEDEEDYDALEPADSASTHRTDSPMTRKQASKKRPPSVLNDGDRIDLTAPSPSRRKTT